MGRGRCASALSGGGDWAAAHAALSRLARERAALDAEEGRWLLCAWRSAAHAHLGYGSFVEYVERLLGYRPRTTQEKLQVAEALEVLPRLASAVETGDLHWCAARELTRVAVPETEAAWLDVARGKTLREVELLVASRSRGDAPDGRANDLPRSRVLRFEVSSDTFATFREALQQLRREAGGSLDIDAALLAMARHVLGGPRDGGRSSYQVSLNVCEACSAGAQLSGGELVPVEASVVEMAACDAQHLGGFVSRGAEVRAANENARSVAVSADDDAAGRAHDAPAEPKSDAVASDIQVHAHAHAGAENQRVIAAACDAAGVGAGSTPRTRSALAAATAPAARAEPHAAPRAKQSIPPALRRAVLTRDRYRCRAPGCRHATFVDVHHVQPRSEGGRNEAANLLTLCSAHHRAVHRGQLLIEREQDAHLVFRHADGATYGNPMAPRLIDAHAKIFSALRQLGFREGEVKAVLAELRADAALEGTSLQHLLGEALRRIRLAAR